MKRRQGGGGREDSERAFNRHDTAGDLEIHSDVHNFGNNIHLIVCLLGCSVMLFMFILYGCYYGWNGSNYLHSGNTDRGNVLLNTLFLGIAIALPSVYAILYCILFAAAPHVLHTAALVGHMAAHMGKAMVDKAELRYSDRVKARKGKSVGPRGPLMHHLRDEEEEDDDDDGGSSDVRRGATLEFSRHG
jgi:hypothetical protein